jgi:NitT/TauT family transport system substrate-binding protein
LAATFLVWQGSAPATAQSPKLLVGTQPYPGEANIFVAKAKGFFAEAGVTVDDRKMQSGRLTMDAMLSGSLDIATPVETGPMFAIANGTDLVILAQCSTNHEEVKPVIAVASGVKTAKDLKGKRLGYGAGSSNQFAMYNWLKAGGIAAADATLVNLQPADLVTGLISGELDVAFTWEPFLTAAITKGAGKVVVIDGQALYQSRLLLVARRDWAEQHSKAVTNLLVALQRADTWIRSNRAEAVQITADAISMDPKALDPIFDRWTFELELSKGLLDAFNAQFAWASTANLLPPGTKPPDYGQHFLPDSLRAVKPDAITYAAK